MPRRGIALAWAAIVLALTVAGCEKPLPQAGSADAQLYAQRCGGCHRPYNPHAMTAAMWEIKVAAMHDKIAAAGQPPLTPAQERAILDYLRRNAGQQ